MNTQAATLGILAIFACLVTFPSTASACGAPDMGCGVIEGMNVVSSHDGVVEVQFRGAFAWTSGAGYGGMGEDASISKPIMAFFQTRCEKDDPNYTYCRQAVADLIAGVKDRKPVSFWLYGCGIDEKPFVLHQGGEAPTPTSFWDLPFPLGSVNDSPACAPALRLLRSLRQGHNIVVDSAADSDFSVSTDLSHIEVDLGDAPQATAHVDVSLVDSRDDLDLGAAEAQQWSASEFALVQDGEPEAMGADERMTGCSAAATGPLGLGGGFFAWILALGGLMAMRRKALALQ